MQSASELPDFTDAENLFMDMETKNNTQGLIDNDWSGLYPWKGDRIGGIAVTADDCPDAFYIPVRHSSLHMPNVPLDAVQRWLKDHTTKPKQWVNHNIVVDAVFAAFDGASPTIPLLCTLTIDKVHDSDRMGHGLDECCKHYGLPYDDGPHQRIKAYLEATKSRDYASVPPDIMGNYACGDVLNNRNLYKYLLKMRPPEMASIWSTESALTSVLFDCEMDGLLIDPRECKKDTVKCLSKMIMISEELEKLTEREWTNSWQCIYDILINQFGLPVLLTKKERDEDGYEVDTGRATFDKIAMPMYEIHPTVKADPKIAHVIELIREYRKESQHKSLFLDSFLGLHDHFNLIHPTYNQVVRTGRMSCKRPNAQQQNKRSKMLIHPRAGNGIMSCDYSQIEYRLIAHYIGDEDIIRAYNEDPDTDFHKWVADLLGVRRKAGKVLNFGMAYGAGKKKVTAGLISNPDIMEEVGDKVNKMIELGMLSSEHRNVKFEQLCSARAASVYNEYHERIPGIKGTSRRAAEVCKMRGFVFNAYGRRRYLPEKASHKAFNSIIQGCAMDIMKERMVALSPRFNQKIRDWGLRLAGNVHDEVFFEGPKEVVESPEVQEYVVSMLQTPTIKFKVPIVCGLGLSVTNWSQAASDDVWVDDAGAKRFGKLRGKPDKVHKLAGMLGCSP